MLESKTIGHFTFNGRVYFVNNYPFAAHEIQLVITDDIGEIQSVCYVLSNDTIYWKFNRPANDVREQIEKKILEIVKKWRDGL